MPPSRRAFVDFDFGHTPCVRRYRGNFLSAGQPRTKVVGPAIHHFTVGSNTVDLTGVAGRSLDPLDPLNPLNPLNPLFSLLAPLALGLDVDRLAGDVAADVGADHSDLDDSVPRGPCATAAAACWPS